MGSMIASLNMSCMSESQGRHLTLLKMLSVLSVNETVLIMHDYAMQQGENKQTTLNSKKIANVCAPKNAVI